MLLMGKSTISTGPFSIAILVHQRVIDANCFPQGSQGCLDLDRYSLVRALFYPMFLHCGGPMWKHYPDAPCMVYLPTFGLFLGQNVGKKIHTWSIWVMKH